MIYDFYITGTIGCQYDWWTGQRGTTFNDVKRFLEENKDKEVNIAVSSPGGYLDDGIAICELIASHGKCNMYIIGMTASAATILCMKAKSVNIAKGSLMLIHNSSCSLELWTSANKQGLDTIIENFKKKRSELDTFDKAIASIYSSRNNKSLEENLAMMDKEKWMLAEDALDFGIVDAIIDDEESTSQAKAVKNSCVSRDGLTAHYGIPDIPMNEDERNSFWMRMRESLSSFSRAMNDKHIIENKSNKTMKKIILNLVCACLAVTDITANEKGEIVLTEDQLNELEAALKEKDGRISDLEKDLQTEKKSVAEANSAKEIAENNLQSLQTKFDEFKNEVGEHSSTQVKSEAEPVTSASMYESIKSLL